MKSPASTCGADGGRGASGGMGLGRPPRSSERGVPPPKPQEGYHRLERTTEPCIVGFDVSGDASCPLYQTEPTIERLGAFLEMAANVVRQRALVRRRADSAGHADMR